MKIYNKQDCVLLVITHRYRSAGIKPKSIINRSAPRKLNIKHLGLTRQQARNIADRIEKYSHVFRVQVFVKNGGFI